MVALVTVVVLLLFTIPSTVFAQANTTYEKQLEVTVQIDTPSENGLYLEGKIVSIRIITENIGNETKYVSVTGYIWRIVPSSTSANNEELIDELHDDNNNALVPGQVTYNFMNNVYSAGNYHMYVLSTPTNGGGGDYEHFYFTINTAQDLFVKKQADFTEEQAKSAAQSANIASQSMLVAVISIVLGSIIAGATLFISNKQRKATEKYSKEQIDAVTKSNELLRTELRARLRPQLEFAKTQGSLQGFEGGDHIRFWGRIRNAGSVPARNIVASSSVTGNDQLAELIREKSQLRLSQTRIGTILPGGYFDYYLTKQGPETAYLAIWFEYTFLGNEKEEALVWINLIPGSEELNHRWFTHEDISEARKHM
ncbi:hypothetical protein [Nitrososphaera sp.]|uniref:hypothetical protein n=1 Tax=Nitrososphaera sp. TaxID=1971748 RepID=UPI0031804AAB